MSLKYRVLQCIVILPYLSIEFCCDQVLDSEGRGFATDGSSCTFVMEDAEDGEVMSDRIHIHGVLQPSWAVPQTCLKQVQ